MIVTRTSPHPLGHRRRAIAWLGLLALLLSLLAPQLSIEGARAAQALTSQREACDEGFVLDERTGECEPEPQRVPARIAAECPAGTVLEPETGACIPAPETVTPTGEATDAPETEPPTETATAPPAPVGYVQAIKRACPDGFAPDETTTITELQDTCLDPIEGVLFDLLVGDIAHASAPTDATGLAQLGSAPVGDIALVEEIPAGYGEPVVYCAEGYAFGPFEHTWTEDDRQPVLDGSTIAWTLPADTLLQCVFYNIAGAGDTPGDLTTQGEIEDGEGAEVIIVKHRCPLGVPEDSTVDQYIAICTALFAGIDFTLDHAGGSFPGTTGEDGQVSWPGVPAGGIDIQEDIPDGYKDPLAFCDWFDGENVLLSGQVDATGGLIELDVPAGATAVACHVFNIADPDQATSVTVNKWRCHPSFDKDTDDPEIACATPMDGVTFTLDGLEATTGEVVPGQAVFLNMPAGDYVLAEDAPETIDHAFIHSCSVNGEDAGLIVLAGDIPSLPLQIESGDHWVCEWYNVPKPDNRVIVHKALCDPGLDLIAEEDIHSEIQDIIDSCPTDGDGIEFTLDNAEGSSTQAIAGGATWWDGVPVGPFTITEHIPAGYGEPIVYCQTNTTDENGDVVLGDWALVPAPGGVVTGSMDAEYHDVFSCWILNVPSDTSNLTVMKWTCPPGYDVHAEGADPTADCTEAANGIQFQFGQPGLGEEAALQETGDVVDGGVRFTGLEQGSWKLVEFAPDGTNGAFIGACTVNGAPVPSAAPLNEGFEWEVDIQAAQTILCHWYNVPAGDNDIDIFKWRCPEGTGHDEDIDWYFDTCTEALDGITFAATSDLGVSALDTVGGQVGFGGFPAGMDVGIQEEIPGEYGEPVVVCGFDNIWSLSPAPAGFIDHTFDGSGETLVCHWFNIPGEPPSITILKWTCPPGYDLFAAGADPKSDCTEATNGVDFQLGPSGGAVVAEMQATGDVIDGGVVFDGLEPGAYKAVEVVPEGIASVFVLECTGHLMGVLQPYPLQMGNVLDDIDLDAGEHLTCDWYNVPEVEGGTLTVIKYICATETFVGELDCEVYEGGVTFDLLRWDGADWQVAGTDTTDGVGLIAWAGLDPGDYWLDEHGGAWCHIAATPEGDDDAFPVADGEETVVEVYNCDPDWTTTTIPEKYPNTGVPPAEPDTQPTVLPALAQLAATLLLLGVWRNRSPVLARRPATRWPETPAA